LWHCGAVLPPPSSAATPLPAGQPSPFLCLAPFSLLHALSLAELGLLPGAAAYSQALAATLQVIPCRCQ
jgi:hypothetical protein